MDQLELFINTLPKDKLMEQWTERYIDDVDTFEEYNLTKDLAIKTNRYVSLNKMGVPGYSLDISCVTDTNKCNSCCDTSGINSEEEKCIYNSIKCNEFFAENVVDWSTLCGYHILFLQEKTPGTPEHPDPWNKETSYIRDVLIKILEQNILTRDSQPGLFVYDKTEYIQKPYLVIGGPVERIHQILIKLLFNNGIIKLVSDSLTEMEFDMYKNFEDNGVYVSVTLGIDTPPFLSTEYSKYVFSNDFFNQILNSIN